MADNPVISDRRFHTSDSGELRHNSIHDRGSNHSSSPDDSDNDDDERQQQPSQQQTPTLSLQKPPLVPGSEVPMVSVQVVDRLRWWRTRRVREQPLPVHHYVFRGNYTNYSSFGTRPLAPGLSRLLEKARRVRAEYQRQQQLLQRQQLLLREASIANSSVDDADHRHQQHQQQQLTREESDLLDNKRASSTAVSASAAAATPLLTPPDSNTHPGANRDAQHAGTSPNDAAPPAVAVPPLNMAAIGSSSGSASVTSTNCPTAQEVHEAERLLRLYQPRAASLPVRLRHQRRVRGYGGVSAGAQLGSGHGGAEEHTSQSIHLKGEPTSDDMTEVCGAAVAADSVVVLHHEPRLVIYGRDLNPRAALRAARVSSDALEGLRDVAAENSAEVFALTNLPLRGFERFFYQQQLRDGRQGEACALSAVTDAMQDSSNNANNSRVELPGATVPSAPPANEDGDDAAYPPGYGVVNREDALYFGAPMTISSLVFSTRPQKPALPPATGLRQPAHQPPDTSNRSAEPPHGVASRTDNKGDSTRRPRRWTSLRAVSVPCLPRVYKSGCPQLLFPHAVAAAAASCAEATSVSATAAEAPATTERGRSRAGQRGGDRHLLPSALRSGDRLQEGVHLCHRVDDLQDVYAFNPIFDALGKGAFSKVYAAVPILRGRDGMQRFRTLDDTNCMSTAVTPTSSPAALNSLSPDAAAATAPRRTPLRVVPVVALKVIPRKARQKARGDFVDSPASAARAQHPPPPQESTNANNSVRRELVEIEREVSILRRLHHTGCSHFYEALRSPDAFAIAMRVHPGSMDARHYLSRYGPPSEARTAVVLFQLVSTVHYLHTNFGLIHRDIKLENLLFSEVDTAVSTARMCEVLGNAVHKADPAAAATGEDSFAERWSLPCAMPLQDSKAAASIASKAHEVSRLLRVTLIDFGLARRTRTAGVSASVSRPCGDGTRNQSFSASINSSSNVASGAVAANPVGPAGVGTSGCNNTANLPSPNVLSGASVGAVSPSASLAPPASTAATSAAAFTATRSANNSSSAVPATQPPLWPPRLCRISSTAAHNTIVGAGSSRAGMPSPMPSTANMFARFLDLDEELDDVESVANGAPTADSAGAARANTEMVVERYEASITSPHTVNSFRRPGSRTDFPEEEESAASSTDVSASETDSESDHGDDGEEEAASARGEAASTDEPATITLFAQMVSDQSGPTSILVAAAQPSPALVPNAVCEEPLEERRSGTCGGVGRSSANASNTPSALHPRLPPPQHIAPRDDTEATLLLTPCGTEKYLPPEVLSWVLERGWTRRSTTVGLARAMDMYAIGIVAYVLLSGCFPFNASSRATLLQQQQRVPRCNSARWSGVSGEAIAFVRRLLEPNPLKRMSAKEALEHPFLLDARHLAEKLSLVPHGEGAEVSRSGDDGGSGGGDAPFAARTNVVNSSSSRNLSTHGLFSPNSSMRAIWSATAARGLSQPPLATFTDRAHSGANGGYHRTSSLASPVKSGNQTTFNMPCRSAFSKSSTPDASFMTVYPAGTAASGGGEAEATGSAAAAPATGSAVLPQRKTAATTPLRSNTSRDGGEAVLLHSADSAQPDVFTVMPRVVRGSSKPPMREAYYERSSPTPPHSPSPVPPVVHVAPPAVATGAAVGANAEATEHAAAEIPVTSPVAKPSPSSVTSATTSDMKTSVTAAKVESPASPKPSSALVNPSNAKSGGDDLFESLYHNIMLSDS
ncbi:putative protein kinase [Leptomonas pyrrhocoris]|uniref:Protein kinase domain-containing protein n=1 Tax=Leptomonas pyrrhocoris TaxID=157538 RepID=A0A0N0DRA2_LEPPY|nr:putative protein kinase [Leptomonas pyrrhocoris]KPA74161.1 putative protein kinase [Leptomonas pyrrhocoris]|eukprot:XP_015652600.1 putative protein kinase [Leptomonas pyrrhocoris]